MYVSQKIHNQSFKRFANEQTYCENKGVNSMKKHVQKRSPVKVITANQSFLLQSENINRKIKY